MKTNLETKDYMRALGAPLANSYRWSARAVTGPLAVVCIGWRDEWDAGRAEILLLDAPGSSASNSYRPHAENVALIQNGAVDGYVLIVTNAAAPGAKTRKRGAVDARVWPIIGTTINGAGAVVAELGKPLSKADFLARK
jgi:microcompartment protein CcmK/EutM